MKKLGRLAGPVLQQLCYAHALQLSILDVLYEKKVSAKAKAKQMSNKTSDFCEEERSSDDESEEESDEDQNDEDHVNVDFGVDDEDTDLHEESVFAIDINNKFGHKYRQDISTLILNIRTISKHFRNRPLANEHLQTLVQETFQKELEFILDCKTRWSSLLAMFERFQLIYPCALKVAKEFNLVSLITDIDTGLLGDVVDALKPLEVVTKKICQRDANLIVADKIFSIALNILRNQNTAVSKKIHDSLLKRLLERRTLASDVLYYLHFRKMNRDAGDVFKMATRVTIVEFLRQIISRLNVGSQQQFEDEFHDDLQDLLEAEVEEDASPPKRSNQMTIEEEMILELDESLKNNATTCSSTLTLVQIIKKEMELFENGESLGSNLKFVYDILLNIKPTSVENERVFSSSGFICSKTRSRLSDQTLSNICYLKSYFLQKNLQ